MNESDAAMDLLLDAYARVARTVSSVLGELESAHLHARLDPQANSISWLIWHLTRVQDDHISDLVDVEQVWTAQGWVERFGLPFEASDFGYGHSPEQVAALAGARGEDLAGYHEQVHAATASFLRTVRSPDLTQIVDPSWDPPVTLGVRLVSVISDNLQHAGQAAFIRGVLEREAG